MTEAEFEGFLPRFTLEYAMDKVRAGVWSEEEGLSRAKEQIERLLPLGLDSQSMLMLLAETIDKVLIGYGWLSLSPREGFTEDGWIYYIEVVPEQQRKGYGRSLLRAMEEEAARCGVRVVGLNVFGGNAIARHLYESEGYEVTSLQMRKGLQHQT